MLSTTLSLIALFLLILSVILYVIFDINLPAAAASAISEIWSGKCGLSCLRSSRAKLSLSLSSPESEKKSRPTSERTYRRSLEFSPELPSKVSSKTSGLSFSQALKPESSRVSGQSTVQTPKPASSPASGENTGQALKEVSSRASGKTPKQFSSRASEQMSAKQTPGQTAKRASYQISEKIVSQNVAPLEAISPVTATLAPEEQRKVSGKLCVCQTCPCSFIDVVYKNSRPVRRAYNRASEVLSQTYVYKTVKNTLTNLVNDLTSAPQGSSIKISTGENFCIVTSTIQANPSEKKSAISTILSATIHSDTDLISIPVHQPPASNTSPARNPALPLPPPPSAGPSTSQPSKAVEIPGQASVPLGLKPPTTPSAPETPTTTLSPPKTPLPTSNTPEVAPLRPTGIPPIKPPQIPSTQTTSPQTQIMPPQTQITPSQTQITPLQTQTNPPQTQTKPPLGQRKGWEVPVGLGVTIHEAAPGLQSTFPPADLSTRQGSSKKNKDAATPSIDASVSPSTSEMIRRGPMQGQPLRVCPSCLEQGRTCVRGCPYENPDGAKKK